MRGSLLLQFVVLAIVAGIGLAEAGWEQGVPAARPRPSFPQGDPTGREFVFRFAPRITVDRCRIHAHQTGGFGGFGGVTKPIRLRANTLAIRTGFDNQPARTLKAAVWCPGFAMALVDVPSLEQSGWRTSIDPVPLRDLPLNGRIVPPDDGVSLAGATVRVYYSADWLCGFFGLADCLVPSWEIATGRIADDRTFRVMLPDFMNDASVRSPAGRPESKGSFRLRADRQAAPWNYWLWRTGDTRTHLPVATEYRDELWDAGRP